MSVNKSITDLLDNYTLCQYPLSLEQIHRMLPHKISQDELLKTLVDLKKMGKIITDKEHGWYTIRGYESIFNIRKERKSETIRKNAILSQFCNIASIVPGIRFIGVTGSCALDNADYSDDIDIMIITAEYFLFICRIFVSLFVFLIGKRRTRGESSHPDAVCINIWIDGMDMLVPAPKQTLYGAREIINMIPILNRNQTYERFLKVNDWVAGVVPNCNMSTEVQHKPIQDRGVIIYLINSSLAKVQLAYMRPHITNEIVSDTQLWLHPKLRGKPLVDEAI